MVKLYVSVNPLSILSITSSTNVPLDCLPTFLLPIIPQAKLGVISLVKIDTNNAKKTHGYLFADEKPRVKTGFPQSNHVGSIKTHGNIQSSSVSTICFIRKLMTDFNCRKTKTNYLPKSGFQSSVVTKANQQLSRNYREASQPI